MVPCRFVAAGKMGGGDGLAAGPVKLEARGNGPGAPKFIASIPTEIEGDVGVGE